MTDEEIKKALGCIKSSGLRKLNKCGSCKYSKSNVCNIWDLLKDALDLINRKDAEIERLKQLIADKGGLVLIETAKSEAIKEFVERLKAKCTTLSDYRKAYVIIDTLVKEMAGE